MPTLAIMNYATAEIELIELSAATAERYAEDYDKLVFKKMGYKPSEVYYMVADSIDVIKRNET